MVGASRYTVLLPGSAGVVVTGTGASTGSGSRDEAFDPSVTCEVSAVGAAWWCPDIERLHHSSREEKEAADGRPSQLVGIPLYRQETVVRYSD